MRQFSPIQMVLTALVGLGLASSSLLSVVMGATTIAKSASQSPPVVESTASETATPTGDATGTPTSTVATTPTAPTASSTATTTLTPTFTATPTNTPTSGAGDLCSVPGWQQDEALKDILVYSLESTPQEIYAGTWGQGVYRRPHNATDWESLGPEEARISALALDPSSGDLFAGTNGEGLKRRVDPLLRPPKWEPVQGIDSGYNIWSLLINEGAMYAGTGEHGAYKSTDGRRWSEHNGNIEAETVYALARNRSGYYAGTGGRGVFVEAGDNWIAIGPSDTTVVRALAAAPDSEVLYAGTVDTGIYRRSAGSSQWNQINTGLAGNDFDIYALAVDPALPRFVYAAQWGAGVYLSWDAGNSWYRLGSPEGPHPQFVLALELVRPQDAGCQILYAGASDGLWSRVISEREFTFLPVLLRDYPEAQ